MVIHIITYVNVYWTTCTMQLKNYKILLYIIILSFLALLPHTSSISMMMKFGPPREPAVRPCILLIKIAIQRIHSLETIWFWLMLNHGVKRFIQSTVNCIASLHSFWNNQFMQLEQLFCFESNRQLTVYSSPSLSGLSEQRPHCLTRS